MISLEVKPESKASSPLSLNVSEEEPTVSFSELLHGIKEAKDGKDAKKVQNGSLVLSLGATDDKDDKKLSKKDVLTALLKGDAQDIEATLDVAELGGKTAKADVSVLELNPKIAKVVTVVELKEMIVNAKAFLKEKILNSEDYKKAQVKELPKTLKGLAQMAKSFGIDVSKITFEEVKPVKALQALVKESEVKPLQRKEIPKETKTVESDDGRLTQALEVKKDNRKELINEQKVDTRAEHKTEAKHEPKVQIKSEQKVEIKSEQNLQSTQEKTNNTQVVLDDVKEEKVAVRIDEKVKPKSTQKIQIAQEADQELRVKEEIKEVIKDGSKSEQKRLDILRDLKTTPLFKAQEKLDPTTEQIVQTKQIKIDTKTTAKSKADETLKLLLRGEKPVVDVPSNMTKDFSVATARVIAPQATTEATKTMEQLLRGDDAKDDVAKMDNISTHKSDSFEVKLNEAKQMIKYLSQDVKTAIEDYKSPFHRVKVQLNPAKMGEVDITVVQRGKNLHVNISSNTAAINTLAINANELKTQLNSNGINNASLNFNNESQNSEQHSGGQNRRHGREANEEYNYFANEEKNEEILSSLEIIVPQYG